VGELQAWQMGEPQTCHIYPARQQQSERDIWHFAYRQQQQQQQGHVLMYCLFA
jgi:hypothetical protein